MPFQLPDHIAIDSSPAPLISQFFACRTFTKIALLADDHTLTQCYPLVKDSLPPHEIIAVPAGEEYKNLETCQLIWQKLTHHGFDRHSLLIMLGGGVLGDMGGFCAATYKRGINFLLLPTTLLAQVDASIGGKMGIDFDHYKNHIGVFQEPNATLIATDFLTTLPQRELRSGFAEVIKHCIISDKAMWNLISSKPMSAQSWPELITHSVAFKYGVIQQDPREKGLRKILNFGHSIGHAVETFLLASGNKIFHGEAIAIGMITESFIASRKKLITADQLNEITSYVASVFEKVSIPDTHELIPILHQDKKNKGDQLLMALPEGIGSAVWDIAVEESAVRDALTYYKQR